MRSADSLEKTLMLGKIEGRRRGWQRMRRLGDITNSMDMSLSKLQEIVKNREAWHTSVHGVAKSWTRLRDWTTTTLCYGPNCVPTKFMWWSPSLHYLRMWVFGDNPFKDIIKVARLLSCFSCVQLFITLQTIYSPPGSSIHGILQARALEWLPCPPPGDLHHPGIEPMSLMSPALAGEFFTTSTSWEAHN